MTLEINHAMMLENRREADLMKRSMTQEEQNLVLLEKLFPENDKCYIWCYAPDGHCVATSCLEQEKAMLDQAFRILGGHDKAELYCKSNQSDRPMIIGSPIGMQWALTMEADRNRQLLFVIGPVFYAAPQTEEIRNALQPYLTDFQFISWAEELLCSLPVLPVLSFDVFSRYVLMVHNTLTGRQCDLQELITNISPREEIRPHPAEARDRSQVYRAEKALLEMVRQGNINYQSTLERSIALSSGVPIHGNEPLRQMKTSNIVFTSLVCRAAMEGGLSPEVAYSLGDSYIQAVENCRDSGELSALATAMYHDFIYRVHYLHANPNYSHAIQKCCDYIELSLDRKICAGDLASLVGYTEYYLTEKFKKETGKSVSEYIRQMKIDRAKLLLQSTNMSVQEIAERLAFNTPNYFIQCFRDLTGSTPAQFRKRCADKDQGGPVPK